MLPDSMRCFLVMKSGKDAIAPAVERRPLTELPPGDVLIRVAYSSVNYKDALAATGHPGVARKYPHVPGIDAAGTVVQSTSPDFRVGEEVVVTSYEMGVERWGGWAEFVRAPSEWVLPLPPGLPHADSMTLGTAGLAAGLSVRALQERDVLPASGEVLVTGATGGVGCLSVALLAKLGYKVVAVTGKGDQEEWLRSLGASRVVSREEIFENGKRPLSSARWAGAVDTVGDGMLAALLPCVKNEGCVAACGVAGGGSLETTVYPFIIRGVTLRGIDTAWCSRRRRREIWDLFATTWRLDALEEVRSTIGLADLDVLSEQILDGDNVGRTVVDVGGETLSDDVCYSSESKARIQN